jgi:hypothetical protein
MSESFLTNLNTLSLSQGFVCEVRGIQCNQRTLGQELEAQSSPFKFYTDSSELKGNLVVCGDCRHFSACVGKQYLLLQ